MKHLVILGMLLSSMAAWADEDAFDTNWVDKTVKVAPMTLPTILPIPEYEEEPFPERRAVPTPQYPDYQRPRIQFEAEKPRVVRVPDEPVEEPRVIFVPRPKPTLPMIR